MDNLLEHLTPATLPTSGLAWEHDPLDWQPLPGGGIRVTTPARADYFRDPAGGHVNDSAPFLWKTVTGDFIARGRVRPTFQSTYDSGVLMVRHDAEQWAKLCFEKTDFGTTAAVSVVTRGVSDDANGADLTVPDLWLQMIRVGNVIGLHYSLDGQAWRMVRLFRLDVPAAVRVGLVAQCPAGPGTTIDFLSFSVEERTAANIRTGQVEA
jgi:regulation of enolase protein 1 (concanavalin A-like superfamily)